jgi:hypothetical protein
MKMGGSNNYLQCLQEVLYWLLKSCWFLSVLTFVTVKTERYVNPKRRLTFTTLHAVTFRKIRYCDNLKSK